MMKKLLYTIILVCLYALGQAQSVNEIVNEYFEISGGIDKYKELQGLKINAYAKEEELKIPIEVILLADGRKITKVTVQGNTIRQDVFDGNTLWEDNYINMTPEKKSKEETENYKKNIGQFPDSFLGYKERGWTLELLGKETVDGTECHKLKLTKLPIQVDGEEVESIEYHYLDTDSKIKLMEESTMMYGPMKGSTLYVKFSDYQEVDGLLFPFSIEQGIKGENRGGNLFITKIALNPTVADDVFAFKEDISSQKDSQKD